MSVKCQLIMDAMNQLAPDYLAEDWDNVGLLVGNPGQKIRKVLVVLDVTPTVVDYAVDSKVDMIISHHPLIFHGMKNIRTDLYSGMVIAKLLKADIAVYAAHTNLDITAGGVNDSLARKLLLQNIRTLNIYKNEKLLKLVVFVPQTHIVEVRSALTEAGGGHIGKYSHCTFQSPGKGAFLPLEGTNPFIGTKGELEIVDEYRLETIVPESGIQRIINAMLKVHPYEEVAYDVYSLENKGQPFGLGRIGELLHPTSLTEFICQVKQALSVSFVRVAGQHNAMINKVAICGGSGAGLISEAVALGADVLVTGDVKYHEAHNAVQAGISVIDAGHFATEQPVIADLVKYLNNFATQHKWFVEIESGEHCNKDIFDFY
ncbi:UPF0135 protein [Propionispora sp. 2/2-37]|uniref:Nif3-like dinuclear metal center hexameric protein n=1 Tax=Propionispora sp. 2/2-37 TaxID=1677858 RepID=UPI0006BB80CF|nr:Nif3-like dinuclear metal center hexameric protein [Propionispora sp. 2/2-37]CUH94176.1 UPF0135 protein [Propionispora sp. 2/2-37]